MRKLLSSSGQYGGTYLSTCYNFLMKWHEFESKLNNWRKISIKSWWLRTSGEPPLYKLMWKLKIKVRPPYFSNPFLLAIGMGIYFGIATFILFNAILSESFSGIIASEAGLGFGCVISTWYFVERKIRKLPRWEDL